MKKVFFILMAAMVMLTSCKESFSLAYSVTANGDANGDVLVTFPDGEFSAKGTAEINFKWDNDTTNLATYPMTLQEAYRSKDKKVVKAAEEIDEFVDAFGATSAGGDYYVHIVGYVTETLTGVKISIDKEFTNRVN